jgi:hypothetical protein
LLFEIASTLSARARFRIPYHASHKDPIIGSTMSTIHCTIFGLLFALTTSAFGADGLISLKSPHGVKETIDRFETAAKTRKLNIFLRLDHAAGA